MDLRKAYDTLNWDFLKDMMIALNFPPRLNAEFDKEILCPLCSLSLTRNTYLGSKVAGEAEEFNFLPRCSKIKLNHLIFADDFMLFCKGNIQSIKILIKGVETFSSSSGLKANNNKSAIYLAGVSDSVRSHAASTLYFAFESLPVKYLGMALISK
ncbi:uncharacterized protein LOC130798178 [Amaranthus tricolor]|uniref:uncharacterized protein LOC130798178 n=1 Tax=Amaranthus tricolor TaxID=29722 RepID=UPI00258D2B4E|nr:uncharacterized protein LOC130798178 [Amaranthus tricolor]